MSVSVRIPTILRTYTGGESEVSASGDTLSEVLDDLDAQLHRDQGRGSSTTSGELRRFVNVYVGNDDVRFLENLADADARRRADLGDPRGRRGLIPASTGTGGPGPEPRSRPASVTVLCPPGRSTVGRMIRRGWATDRA